MVLVHPGDRPIAVIKAVRELTGLGLAAAKHLVDGAPRTVLEGLDADAAREAEARLTGAGDGVQVQVRPSIP